MWCLARDTCQLVSTAVTCLPRELPSAWWRGGKAEPFLPTLCFRGGWCTKGSPMASVQHNSPTREGKISAWKAVPLHQLLHPNKHSLCLLYWVRLSGHLEKKAGFGVKDLSLLLGGDLGSLGMGDFLYILVKGWLLCCRDCLLCFPCWNTTSQCFLGSGRQCPYGRHTESAAFGKANIILKLAWEASI